MCLYVGICVCDGVCVIECICLCIGSFLSPCCMYLCVFVCVWHCLWLWQCSDLLITHHQTSSDVCASLYPLCLVHPLAFSDPPLSFSFSFSVCECQSLRFLCPHFQMDLLPYQTANEAALFTLWLFEWKANHLTPPAPPLDPHVFLVFTSFHAEYTHTSGQPRGPSHMPYWCIEQKMKTWIALQQSVL